MAIPTGTDIAKAIVDRAAKAVGFVDRAVKGANYAINGVDSNNWFGPQQPLPPFAQQDAYGRQFDYPVGYNTTTTPRQYEPISFAQLRGLADGYDLLRLIIERRKDQICNLPWDILPRLKEGQEATDAEKANADALETFFRYPDKQNDFPTWLRMLLEDVLVLDAPAVLVRKTRGGQLYGLELLDGATIKPLIDVTGRQPMYPDPSYQQVLKGVPAVDYTTQELIYRPRNRRTNKVYGYSPVEQCIVTINIALRRQISHLEYFTAGNMPDAIIGVPDTWGADEIERFQKMWDALHSGDTAQRRKARFIPGQGKYQATKSAEIIDPKFEEWIARIMCFAFAMPPTPFVQLVNRSTAETMQDSSGADGLGSLKAWVKDFIDYLLTFVFNQPQTEFVWRDTKSVDPMVQAETDKILIDAKIIDPAEARQARGLPPRTKPEAEDDDESIPADNQG